MNTVAVTVEKPIQEVWDFFTDLPKWKSWWGVAPTNVTPGWQTGSTLLFESGEENDLTVTPLKEIRISSRWLKNIYRFEAVTPTSTHVKYEFSVRGGASFSDEGLGHMREMVSTLRKFKRAAEGGGSRPKSPKPHTPQSARQQSQSASAEPRPQRRATKKWWEFWK